MFLFSCSPARQFSFFLSWEWLALLMQKKFALLQETEGVSFLQRLDGCVVLRRSYFCAVVCTDGMGCLRANCSPKGESDKRGPQFSRRCYFSLHFQLRNVNSFDDGLEITEWVSGPPTPVDLNVVQEVTFSSILMIFSLLGSLASPLPPELLKGIVRSGNLWIMSHQSAFNNCRKQKSFPCSRANQFAKTFTGRNEFLRNFQKLGFIIISSSRSPVWTLSRPSFNCLT